MSDQTSTPVALPELPLITPSERKERARRIFATMRWAGVIAVTEMVDGYDNAMKIVEEGPERFLPDDEDYEKINETGIKAIAYIEGEI